MFDLDLNRGAWDILSWDDDGNMYFICQLLALGDLGHGRIVDAVKTGKRVLYGKEVLGTDATETMLLERKNDKN